MLTIYLDISQKGPIPTVYAKQGEVGRKFRAVITDSGIPYAIPEGALMSVWYSGESGSGNYTHIGEKRAFEPDGNHVTIELITQMLTNEGRGTCCFVLNTHDGKQIGLWNIPYVVEGIPGSGSEEAKQYYTAFSKDMETLCQLMEAGDAGKAIIDVSELPTQDIHYNAFYRVTNVKAYFDPETPHPNLRFLVVSKLPETGLSWDDDGNMLGYYVVPTGEFWEFDDGRYTPDDMVGAGGLGWIRKTDFSSVDVIPGFEGYEPTGNMIFLVEFIGLFYYNNKWIEIDTNSGAETDDSGLVVVTYDKSTMKASMTGSEIAKAIKNGKTVVLHDGYASMPMGFVESRNEQAVVCATGLLPVVKGSAFNNTFEVAAEATNLLFVDPEGNVIQKQSSVTIPTPTPNDDNKVLIAKGDYYGTTKWVELSALAGGSPVSTEPEENDIPKVFFGGPLQQTKTEAVVPFRYSSKTQDVAGYAKIKAQGNSSLNYPKKNQTVKLFRNAECTQELKMRFKGWGEQNAFCFKSNWIDLTHSRNIVSARLWADVIKSRANYEDLPELLRTSPNQGAVDGFPVKVYAAGVYQGRYTINIPKDKWMANMDDSLDTHCILCSENYDSGCFRAAANINSSDWTDEVHDTVPETIKTGWNEVISFVMNSTDEEFRANLGNYFDIPSLIDYHLFGLVSCGLDAYGKNQLYLTYDGQKWIAGMYDLDATWGLYWNGSKIVASDYAREDYEDFVSGVSENKGNLLYIRLERLFCEEVQFRWAELKNGVLSIENIINKFERFTDIASAELVKEDYAVTTGNGAYTSIPSITTNNIQQIRAFALARLAWTDEYVEALSNIHCTGISLDKNALTFEEKGTQTITATVTPDGTTDPITWISSNPAVASVTVDGNVCTVQSLSNGDATITVTCGSYSANCAVSVSGVVDLLYSLPEATTFDGVDDYIDTGVKLYDSAKDFTILFHADTTMQNATHIAMFHCMDEKYPYPGFVFSVGEGTTSYKFKGNSVNSSQYLHNTWLAPNASVKACVTCRNGVITSIRTKMGNNNVVNQTVIENYYVQIPQSLLLACYQTTAGVKGRFWKGTIFDFKIYDRVLIDNEIEEYFNRT